MSAAKAFLRRTFRQVLRFSPRSVRAGVARLPFSRFRHLTMSLMEGDEVVDWRGLRVSIDPGEHIGYFTYLFGDADRVETERLLELCRQSRVFFDVGANIGLMSLAAARQCPHITVVSFEPDPEVGRRFVTNVDLNPDLKHRVLLRQEAAGADNGPLRFSRADATNLGTGRLSDATAESTITVSTRTLDSVCREIGLVPDVIKIDVEGAELSVLNGMIQTLRTTPPRAIMMELHGLYLPEYQDFYRSIHDVLIAADYELQQAGATGFVAANACDTWPSRLHLLALHRAA